jgi:hypothetical protein
MAAITTLMDRGRQDLTPDPMPAPTQARLAPMRAPTMSLGHGGWPGDASRVARTALRRLNEGTVSLHFSSLGMPLARAGAPCPLTLVIAEAIC